jgi:hypothetical protein
METAGDAPLSQAAQDLPGDALPPEEAAHAEQAGLPGEALSEETAPYEPAADVEQPPPHMMHGVEAVDAPVDSLDEEAAGRSGESGAPDQPADGDGLGHAEDDPAEVSSDTVIVQPAEPQLDEAASEVSPADSFETSPDELSSSTL